MSRIMALRALCLPASYRRPCTAHFPDAWGPHNLSSRAMSHCASQHNKRLHLWGSPRSGTDTCDVAIPAHHGALSIHDEAPLPIQRPLSLTLL